MSDLNGEKFVIQSHGLDRTMIREIAGTAVNPIGFLIEKGQIRVMVSDKKGEKIFPVPLSKFSTHPPVEVFLPPDKLSLLKEQQENTKPRTYL